MHILILCRNTFTECGNHSIHSPECILDYINISARDTNMDPQRHSRYWPLLYFPFPVPVFASSRAKPNTRNQDCPALHQRTSAREKRKSILMLQGN